MESNFEIKIKNAIMYFELLNITEKAELLYFIEKLDISNIYIDLFLSKINIEINGIEYINYLNIKQLKILKILLTEEEYFKNLKEYIIYMN